MSFEIIPAYDLSLAEQAVIFNRAFAGYVVRFPEMTPAFFAQFICTQGVDLCYSHLVRGKQGDVVSFAYVNRSGNVARLAAMGTVPEARRGGAAAVLLELLHDEAKARGDEAMLLEVFEQNTPAVELYRRHGFRELTRLFGWRRAAAGKGKAKTSKSLDEISALAAARITPALQYPQIPWQISQYAIAKLPNAHAYRSDGAMVVLGDTRVDPIRIHSLSWDKRGNWEAARSALAAVLGQFPRCRFEARQAFPDKFGDEIFARLGFEREPLNQFLMRRDF